MDMAGLLIGEDATVGDNPYRAAQNSRHNPVDSGTNGGPVRGVPMAVFPIDHDQPDNARRVVHHGLGVSGDLRSFSAGGIAALADQADRPAVRESLARMRRRFLEVEGSGIGVCLIEELLAQDQQKRGQDEKGIRENRTAQSV
jgi:hypothetical protein